MQVVYALLISVMIGGSFQALAHGTHKKLIEAKKAQELAADAIGDLIKKKKIANSWSGIRPEIPQKKMFKNTSEWVVTFIDLRSPDKAKQKLYVFISLKGKVLGVNFTGN